MSNRFCHGAPSAKETAQRAWIAFRDAECDRLCNPHHRRPYHRRHHALWYSPSAGTGRPPSA
ncbi:lysozyme inhibitor LprI family protein [Jiella sonneratiae]|uniref:DUF1311 domain-containing protein n=1 Tax=Jiella sonneratiae TaxID=2816856 RepID=A0ABS3J041_9HYPH|nr:DUF1311 domain-containing protein [Jiella sonneratiae]